MSAQTDMMNSVEFDKDFDENDVFNRLLYSKSSSSRANPAKSLRRIFADAEHPTETIQVEDFLPSYED